MKLSGDDILNKINRSRIIPVFYHKDVEVAKSVLEACYQGGLRVFEFTNRGENAHDVFLELKKYSQKFPDALLGIGTIIDTAAAELFITAEADFIVSPILNLEVAKVCKRHKKFWVPGCGTLTEIVNAKNAGAELIKIFPGSVLGPKFISSVLAVVPDLKLMPTGGVEPSNENLQAWFDAGVYCVGMGSQLISNSVVEGKRWNDLEAAVSKLRKFFDPV
ncbi:MAG TPA: bifunctional 4-hydroxy-2-oxoglutarate aldolase/2-dehydro-3-deoxy-phosphogluconate aldolase [Cyclobacteriaceae bacterium]|jgi:2-dehydro-3-deoxyphosphogluconate aldolase/(4S)-4-hydroxy-2-oxoglutarate aldolase|nr:bifunctional 4-hydroxy-2-oxoglutarate aldolase/2-dehydro-3-deoxy-phosphogluconate aldolase [Cyclobacteriaceae bacterium]